MPSTTVSVVSALAGAACQATATQATASVAAVSFEKIFMLGSILPVRPRTGSAGRAAAIAWVDREAHHRAASGRNGSDLHPGSPITIVFERRAAFQWPPSLMSRPGSFLPPDPNPTDYLP